MSKQYVPVVFFYSGLYRSTRLSDVHLTTLAGYAVYPRSSKSQLVLHRTKETRDLPRRQVNSFNVVFSQHSAGSATCRPDIRKKSDRGGLLLRRVGSNRQNNGPSYLSDTIPIFPERCLEELHLIMEVVTESPGSVHQG